MICDDEVMTMKQKIKLSVVVYWSLVLLPFLISALFYSRLPDEVAIHWGADNQPDGYASKNFAAWICPLIFLAVAFLVNFSFYADPKKKNIDRSKKMKGLGRWFVVIAAPLVQLITMIYAVGITVPMNLMVGVPIGILFAAVGNYLPKCRQNYSMGIKLPWTLADEENWNKTHRLAGYLWIICGVLMVISACLNLEYFVLFVILVMAVVPTLYSYLIYRKKMSVKSKEE